MIGAANRYRELLTQLLIHRELAGGTLPDDVEAQFVEELDRCWWALTSEEQSTVERSLDTEHPPPAEAELPLTDTVTVPGQHDPPRRAA